MPQKHWIIIDSIIYSEESSVDDATLIIEIHVVSYPEYLTGLSLPYENFASQYVDTLFPS